MAKIKTTTLLIDSLDKEWSWRKKEISNLWTVLQGGRRVSKESLIRSFVPILYAHFEGFVKNSVVIFSNFLFYQDIMLEEAAYNIVAIEMKARIQLGTDAKSPGYMINLVKDLDNLEGKCTAIKNFSAYTASNLNYERFQDISISLGIDISKYNSSESLINERLLGLRNTIAHGQYVNVDLEQIEELKERLIDIIEYWKNEIFNIAIFSKYKKDSSKNAPLPTA